MKARLTRWRSLIRPARNESDLEAELAFHLQEETEACQEEGFSAEEAHLAARRSLGNLTIVKEDIRAAMGIPLLETVLQDLRIAARSLRKDTRFAAVAVLILGLGIGASTAVFSVVNAVVLKPLPYPDPGLLVALSSLWKTSNVRGSVSQPDFEDWRAGSTSFETMAYFASAESSAATESGSGFARVSQVSEAFFRVFGIQPAAGRLFAPAEGSAPDKDSAIVSHRFARAHFGSDSALGQTINTGGRKLDIIGVMPEGFHFPNSTDIWILAEPGPKPNRGEHSYRAVARLKRNVTLTAAQSELGALCNRLAAQYPGSNRDKSILVTPLGEEVTKDHAKALELLMGAVFLLLIASCGNVATLLMARGATRMREVGVRIALGASRQRIVRQFLTESLVLGAASGILGLAIARYGNREVIALAPGDLPRLGEIGFDVPVLFFAAGLTLCACLVLGLVPALRILRLDANQALRQGGGQNVTRLSARLRNGLVIVLVAVSVMLLSDAGLLIRSFAELNAVPLGFETRQVIVMETGNGARDPEAASHAIQSCQTLLNEIARIPGVIGAAASRTPPGEVFSQGAYEVDGTADLSAGSPQAVYSVVSPGAFRVLGIPILEGRDFSPQDSPHAARVAIVNKTLARRSFQGVNPIGRSIIAGLDGTEPMTIVGLIGDIHQSGPAYGRMAEIYMPYQQHAPASMAIRILVRTNGPPENVIPLLRQTALRLVPSMPVRFTTMNARLAGNLAAHRFRTILLALLAGLSLAMTMAAIYSVQSFIVTQRVAEIGLRIALGAQSRQVTMLILPAAMRVAAIGALLGVGGAAASGRFVATLLFRTKPFDPLTYAAVAGVIALVSAGACLLPARRAAGIDPAAALRSE